MLENMEIMQVILLIPSKAGLVSARHRKLVRREAPAVVAIAGHSRTAAHVEVETRNHVISTTGTSIKVLDQQGNARRAKPGQRTIRHS